MGIQSALSCIGMSAKVWRKENSLRRVKTLPHSRRTTKKLVLRLRRAKVKKKATVMSSEQAYMLLLRSTSLCIGCLLQENIRSSAVVAKASTRHLGALIGLVDN